MIRVLHSVSNMDRAGIETMLMNYYRHIDREKVQFDFLCNKTKPGAYDKEIESLGGRIFHSPGLNPLKFLEYKKFMFEVFKENPEIKIMHSHNGELAYQSLYAAYKYGIKTRICHAHNTKIEPNLKKPLKLLYKTQLKKVANNYWGCGVDAVRFYFGNKIVEDNKYMVLHNAIEVDRFIYNENIRNRLKREMNLNDKFVIGHVGRFMEQKNHDYILEIFKEVLKEEPNAVLLLIGDGELEEFIKRKAKKLNIYESIKFMGNVNNVNELYQVMDIFILPSLFEGLPVVGIEAQAAGLKCLFSDKVTRETEITDNVYYLGIEKNNLKEWKEKILSNLTYDRKNQKEKIVKAGYSIEDEAVKLVDKYIEFINKGEKNENRCYN